MTMLISITVNLIIEKVYTCFTVLRLSLKSPITIKYKYFFIDFEF